MTWLRTHPTLATLAALCLVGAVAAFVKLSFISATPTGDYDTYISTARLFSGETGAQVLPSRILKPLAPLLVAGLGRVMSYPDAMLLQTLVFYFALIVAMFFFAREFFGERRNAVYATLLVALSYPVLRYGVDFWTETGALFFYVLSLILSLQFLKRPTKALFLGNVLAIVVGFLWKEYAAVAAAIFGVVLLAHPELEMRRKLTYLAAYAALFLAVNVPFEAFIYLKYHYTYLTWLHEGGAPGQTTCGLTVHDVTKSMAALLGLAWLAVPFGLARWRKLDARARLFLAIALPVPFMAFLWGCVSSRLIYVMAPPFVLVAVLGMREWSRGAQYALVALTLATNIAWLFLSYSITL